MERNLCLIQRGPSYQFSPETMSSLPSPLTSATVQASFAPRSIKCFSKGMSSVRPMVQATEAHSASTAAAISREHTVNSLQWTMFARLSGPDRVGGCFPRFRMEARFPSCGKRSEEHTSELQSPDHLVCRLLLEKKNNQT